MSSASARTGARWRRLLLWALAGPAGLAGLLGLAGCANLGPPALVPGFATEADVRARLGEPGRVWVVTPGPGPGGKVLEYTTQPMGHVAYMADIGPDGKLAALRQVLTPDNLAKVKPGMTPTDVQALLGKPGRVSYYRLKDETQYDWRYFDGPNRSDSKIFTAVFDNTQHVVSTASMRDPLLDDTGGGRRGRR